MSNTSNKVKTASILHNLETSYTYEIDTLKEQISYYKSQAQQCSVRGRFFQEELFLSYVSKAEKELEELFKRISEEHTEEVVEPKRIFQFYPMIGNELYFTILFPDLDKRINHRDYPPFAFMS